MDAARAGGLDFYAGVPCSFLTPFIDHVIGERDLSWLPAANEGDAVASAAGAAIGGRRAAALMQNSGLGNAVSPLTSLCWVFRIPLLLVCTHRGAPGLADEPQHELMGRITGDLLRTMDIPWEAFPVQAHDIEPALARARACMASTRRPYALLMAKGTVAPGAPAPPPAARRPGGCERRRFPAPARASRAEALGRVLAATAERETVVIATTGYTGRELYALDDRPNHLYMVGSMGCAAALGLGLALARPDLQVVVIDGDGAALMRLGNLATVGAIAGGNLTHLLLDNEVHESTGGQSTVAGGVAFAEIAAACGYEAAYAGEDPALIDALLGAPCGARPRFGHLKIRSGVMAALPRPAIAPAAVLDRLMRHIGTGF